MDDWKAKRTPMPKTKEDFIEYRKLISEFENACGYNEYQLKYYGILVAYAKIVQVQPEMFENIKEKITQACSIWM